MGKKHLNACDNLLKMFEGKKDNYRCEKFINKLERSSGSIDGECFRINELLGYEKKEDSTCNMLVNVAKRRKSSGAAPNAVDSLLKKVKYHDDESSNGHKNPWKKDKIGQWPFGNGNEMTTSNSMYRGLDHLGYPNINKDLAFTIPERQALSIHGLLPPQVFTQEHQLKLCREQIKRCPTNLDKYIYLINLKNSNERLFFRFLTENAEEFLPIVYTPTVGEACQNFGRIYQRPNGLYITINDKGHVYDVLKNWPETDIRAIVVTDGERILGLGDLGAQGMGIPVGKLALYTVLGGVKPHQCLPITLDVGTKTQMLLDDEFYIGLRKPRTRGIEYEEFLDEFMNAAVKRFGQNVLIQFEDFESLNAIKLLQKYRNEYCTFNDDIQGTAAVILAGILASFRIEGVPKKWEDHRLFFVGGGQANLGIAELCLEAMVNSGIPKETARSKIWMNNSKGIFVQSRTDLTEKQRLFAQNRDPIRDLSEAIAAHKPTILIGATTRYGSIPPAVIKQMATLNKRPVIFALSNPTSKAECTAEEAYTHSDGRAIFASGSPFQPVTLKDGKVLYPGQGNNAYIFPGLGFGIICSGMKHVSDDVFITAAQTLANRVTETHLKEGRLYPPVNEMKASSFEIAVAVVEEAYKKGTATTFPKPENIRAFVEAQLYDYHYPQVLPNIYSWPQS